MNRLFVALGIALSLLPSAAVSGQSVDARLRQLLADHEVAPLEAGGGLTAAKIQLGQSLFFDRELSGNRDTSCATCHHPRLATGDGLALPVGTAPINPGALGHDRIIGNGREFVPRNAPEIFNRGSVLWTSMFWDSRVRKLEDGSFVSPAGEDLLPGVNSVLTIQAMFPVTSRDEMRGRVGDVAVDGWPNELADIDDADLHGIWDALMDRLLALPGYRDQFLAAYPDKSLDELTFADAANAIGAFETDAFTFLDSPFDRYVAGEDDALSAIEKQGALLFYGKAGCATCHAGSLLTDQLHYGLAVPQLGPGRDEFKPLDIGRFKRTLDPVDLFAFRTPPLRNVGITAPYMHNGAYPDLKSVIEHHQRPALKAWTYQPRRQLDQHELIDTVQDDWQTWSVLVASLDIANDKDRRLTGREIRAVEAFLHSLTAPDIEARLEATIPESVPSGLPVER